MENNFIADARAFAEKYQQRRDITLFLVALDDVQVLGSQIGTHNKLGSGLVGLCKKNDDIKAMILSVAFSILDGDEKLRNAIMDKFILDRISKTPKNERDGE